MSIQSGYISYNSITEYQIWLHTSRQKDELIETPFYREHIRVAWHSTFLEYLKPCSVKDSDDYQEITYEVNREAHFLLYTTGVFRTPMVKSHDDRIKIAWTENFMHNFVTNSQLIFNDIPIQNFDTVGADVLIQFMPQQGEGKRKQYLYNIGNRASLIKFSSTLPSTRLSFLFPWSFATRISKAIPLCLATTTEIKLKFTLQKDLTRLLRIREERKDKSGSFYTYRAVRPQDLKSTLEIGSPGKFKVYGKYALVTKSELRWHKNRPRTELFYDTLISLDQYETSSEVKLLSHGPVKALFLVAHNLTAASIGNHSNYTNDLYKISRGISPISKISLLYNGYEKLKDMDAKIFSDDEPYWNCSACPDRKYPGYHAIIFPSSLQRDEDPGMMLTSLDNKLIVSLDDDQLNNCRYQIKVRALTSQVFECYNGVILLPKLNEKLLRQTWERNEQDN